MNQPNSMRRSPGLFDFNCPLPIAIFIALASMLFMALMCVKYNEYGLDQPQEGMGSPLLDDQGTTLTLTFGNSFPAFRGAGSVSYWDDTADEWVYWRGD